MEFFSIFERNFHKSKIAIITDYWTMRTDLSRSNKEPLLLPFPRFRSVTATRLILYVKS